ncbi:hypothetical protein [Reyranella sp.]|uniref:hypothetical protein n=1 Tax=Reyranella sp. TaxID=1929291 RepID=UPI003BAD7E8B
MREFLAIATTFGIGLLATAILAYSVDYHQMAGGTVAQRPAVPDARTVLPPGFAVRPAHQARAPALHKANEI